MKCHLGEGYEVLVKCVPVVEEKNMNVRWLLVAVMALMMGTADVAQAFVSVNVNVVSTSGGCGSHGCATPYYGGGYGGYYPAPYPYPYYGYRGYGHGCYSGCQHSQRRYARGGFIIRGPYGGYIAAGGGYGPNGSAWGFSAMGPYGGYIQGGGYSYRPPYYY